MADQYMCVGKQVLRVETVEEKTGTFRRTGVADFQHFADAVDNEAALLICEALNKLENDR